MADEQLAQTYAQAVFEQAMANWITPLKTIASSITQAGVIEQLDNGSLAFSKKQAILRPLLPPNTSAQVQNLLALLASKNHVHLLPKVIAEFDRYLQRGPVGTRAKITSAVSLTDAEKNALETQLRAQFDRDLTFDYVVDKEILGGVIVRVGAKVIDGSVAGKLAALKERLR